MKAGLREYSNSLRVRDLHRLTSGAKRSAEVQETPDDALMEKPMEHLVVVSTA